MEPVSDAEVIQITGDSYRLRGRPTDKQTGPASQPKSKTGQTRKPGPADEAAENSSKPIPRLAGFNLQTSGWF
ncbi:hypothetical protein RESH_04985 [Rhodopirellula europaea SH398]|uniref:Uncharacterized protein n=1 Tax=Rhodopirellula europaea SH398 TaxID=1263868 RepID=M5SEL7_9BACT|nr:hypothetical protein RESH_04985 [Rhodopirellula europaea SH398]